MRGLPRMKPSRQSPMRGEPRIYGGPPAPCVPCGRRGADQWPAKVLRAVAKVRRKQAPPVATGT